WVVLAHGGFLPTGDTALFLLAGDNTFERLKASALLESNHPLLQYQSLRLEPVAGLDMLGSARLVAAPELVDGLVFGRARRPTFGPAFPAKRLSCAHSWEDLV